MRLGQRVLGGLVIDPGDSVRLGHQEAITLRGHRLGVAKSQELIHFEAGTSGKCVAFIANVASSS